MRTEPFVQNPPDAGSPLNPTRLVDHTWDWASSLLLGVDTHTPNPNAEIPAQVGTIVFQISGLVKNGSYNRRFGLGRYQSVELDVSGFSGLSVYIIGSTLDGVGAFAWLNERPYTATRTQVAYLPESVAAGFHTVPWGARKLTSASADPTFAWVGNTTSGATVSVTDPIAVGDVRDVRGACYTCGAPLVAIWEIVL